MRRITLILYATLTLLTFSHLHTSAQQVDDNEVTSRIITRTESEKDYLNGRTKEVTYYTYEFTNNTSTEMTIEAEIWIIDTYIGYYMDVSETFTLNPDETYLWKSAEWRYLVTVNERYLRFKTYKRKE